MIKKIIEIKNKKKVHIWMFFVNINKFSIVILFVFVYYVVDLLQTIQEFSDIFNN